MPPNTALENVNALNNLTKEDRPNRHDKLTTPEKLIAAQDEIHLKLSDALLRFNKKRLNSMRRFAETLLQDVATEYNLELNSFDVSQETQDLLDTIL